MQSAKTIVKQWNMIQESKTSLTFKDICENLNHLGYDFKYSDKTIPQFSGHSINCQLNKRSVQVTTDHLASKIIHTFKASDLMELQRWIVANVRYSPAYATYNKSGECVSAILDVNIIGLYDSIFNLCEASLKKKTTKGTLHTQPLPIFSNELKHGDKITLDVSEFTRRSAAMKNDKSLKPWVDVQTSN